MKLSSMISTFSQSDLCYFTFKKVLFNKIFWKNQKQINSLKKHFFEKSASIFLLDLVLLLTLLLSLSVQIALFYLKCSSLTKFCILCTYLNFLYIIKSPIFYISKDLVLFLHSLFYTSSFIKELVYLINCYCYHYSS